MFSNRYNFYVAAIADERIGALDAIASLGPRQREEAMLARPVSGNASFDRVKGAAIIPVRGVLLDEWSPAGPKWGATGYNYIRSAVAEASADRSVTATILDIDSPGGLVSGMIETARAIEAASMNGSGKPIFAVIRSIGASAAYALAANTDRIVASDSAEVGSIGARLVHVSVAGAMERAGVKITDISSHPGKILGSAYSDLSASAREEFQAAIDDTGAMFASMVARRRGIGVDAVNSLDGRMFPAQSSTGRKTAVEAGLVDIVMSSEQALSGIASLSHGTMAASGKTTAALFDAVSRRKLRQSSGSVHPDTEQTPLGSAHDWQEIHAAVEERRGIPRSDKNATDVKPSSSGNHGWDKIHADVEARRSQL